jgi:hypothetical protein
MKWLNGYSCKVYYEGKRVLEYAIAARSKTKAQSMIKDALAQYYPDIPVSKVNIEVNAIRLEILCE